MKCEHNYQTLNPGEIFYKLSEYDAFTIKNKGYSMLYCTKCGTTKEVIAKPPEMEK